MCNPFISENGLELEAFYLVFLLPRMLSGGVVPLFNPEKFLKKLWMDWETPLPDLLLILFYMLH